MAGLVVVNEEGPSHALSQSAVGSIQLQTLRLNEFGNYREQYMSCASVALRAVPIRRLVGLGGLRNAASFGHRSAACAGIRPAHVNSCRCAGAADSAGDPTANPGQFEGRPRASALLMRPYGLIGRTGQSACFS